MRGPRASPRSACLAGAVALAALGLPGCAIVAESPPARADLQPFPPGIDAACAGEQPERSALQHFVKPSYPIDAVTRGVQGWVCVGFDLDASGAPVDLTVVAAAPAGVFDEAALAAVRAWRFEPQLGADGQPRARQGLRLPLVFALDAAVAAEVTGTGTSR